MPQDTQLVDALLTLLDDEDEDVARSAQSKLLELGSDVVPSVKDKLDEQPIQVKLRARQVMNQLESNSLVEEFRSIPRLENGDIDLESGLFTITKIGDSGLQPQSYKRKIHELTEHTHEALQRWETRDPHTTVQTVKNVIFDRWEFHGNREEYYEPENSFIHRVLQRRTGIPISLSSVILMVSDRLDLDFQGIGMPGHFVVSHPGEDGRIFLDPFNQGKLLSKKDCVDFLSKTGFDFVREYLEPVSNKEILSRFLRNLINVYQKSDRQDRVKEVRSYLAIIEKSY